MTTTTTTTASAVGAARGLIWLAERARDVGAPVARLAWDAGDEAWTIAVDDPGHAAALAAALRLGGPRIMSDRGPSYWVGDWADMRVVLLSRAVAA